MTLINMAMNTDISQFRFNPFVLFVIFSLYLCTRSYGQNPCWLPAHDMGNITVSEWIFTSTNMKTCLIKNTTKASKCTFVMHLCGAVSSKSCQDASVCETTAPTEYKLAGKADKPFSEYTNGDTGFKATFPIGGKYEYITKDNKIQTCSLNTTMNFNCDVTKPWPMPQMGQMGIVPFQPIIQLSLNGDNCEYNITFSFAGACYSMTPSIDKGGNLSAGSVLVIIFFVFMITYFVFGSVWNTACRGARGPEVIPHLEFWTMLPVYVADGFLFTFRCGNVESSSYDSI